MENSKLKANLEELKAARGKGGGSSGGHRPVSESMNFTLKKLQTQESNAKAIFEKAILDKQAQITLQERTAKFENLRDSAKFLSCNLRIDEDERSIDEIISANWLELAALSSRITTSEARLEKSKISFDAVKKLLESIDQLLHDEQQVWESLPSVSSVSAASPHVPSLVAGCALTPTIVGEAVLKSPVSFISEGPNAGDEEGVVVAQISDEWLRTTKIPSGTQAGQENMAKIQKFSNENVQVRLDFKFGARPLASLAPGCARFRVKVYPQALPWRECVAKLLNFVDSESGGAV